MATRYRTNSKIHHGQSPLPSGYEKDSGSSDLFIPPCGLEDVDVALFNLFDNEIVPEYSSSGGSSAVKVPVIFAAGEKWALLKRGRPIRDRNNSLVLPLITVMRTDVNQTSSDDVVGRGVNQQIGEIVIRRRLDKSDRDYQALINRLFLLNQENLAVRPMDPVVSGQITTDGNIGDLAGSSEKTEGAYLYPNRLNNVYETVVVPTPQFYTAKYQVTVWTQYTQHANQIMEKIFSSFLPQGQCWRLDTAKGYWFVAKFEDGSLSTETNFDDMSQSERYIKHVFNVSVPAYFFASSAPGAPIPIKRYISNPVISFEIDELSSISNSLEDSKYQLGADDPTLPLDEQKNTREDQRTPGWRQQKIYPTEDPALQILPRGYSAKIIGKTSKGETVYSGALLGGIEIIVTK